MIRRWLARGLRRLARVIEGEPTGDFTLVVEGGPMLLWDEESAQRVSDQVRRSLEELSGRKEPD